MPKELYIKKLVDIFFNQFFDIKEVIERFIKALIEELNDNFHPLKYWQENIKFCMQIPKLREQTI